MLTVKTITQYRQNRPTLIVRDLEAYGVPRDVTYRVLLARGVFKWLSARRDLIKVKHAWKEDVTGTIEFIRYAKQQKSYKDLEWLRGYLAALEMCRSDIDIICKQDRWIAPDNDKEAVRFTNQEMANTSRLMEFEKRIKP